MIHKLFALTVISIVTSEIAMATVPPIRSNSCRLYNAYLLNGQIYLSNKQQGRANISLGKSYQQKICQALKPELENIKISQKRFCNLSIFLNNSRFTKISWLPLDISSNLEVAREIFLRYQLGLDFLVQEKRQSFWKNNQSVFKSQVEKGILKIERARFDLDYDKKLETVYRLATYPCQEPQKTQVSWYWSYHVLERDDPLLSPHILGYRLSPFEAFIFEGRTYLFFYDPSDNLVGVYEPQSVRDGYDLAMPLVCEFKVKGV
jgi:hypothetical protein